MRKRQMPISRRDLEPSHISCKVLAFQGESRSRGATVKSPLCHDS